jgi:transglycosylase-like protein with SLT domain
MRCPLWLLLGGVCAFASPLAAEEIYYRKDPSGALVLTNVPDHQDLRSYPGYGRLRGLHSGKEYRELIWKTSLKHGINPELVYAVAAVESSFDRRAVSAKGAQGLMQLMPDTARRFGVSDPFDPADNVLGGVRYLRYLLDMFRGDQRLALAAYNAGENIVLAGRRIPDYPETHKYVAKVLRLFGAKQPYVKPPPGRPVAGGRGSESPIEAFTDPGGVVHITDTPPAGGETSSEAATAKPR